MQNEELPQESTPLKSKPDFIGDAMDAALKHMTGDESPTDSGEEDAVQETKTLPIKEEVVSEEDEPAEGEDDEVEGEEEPSEEEEVLDDTDEDDAPAEDEVLTVGKVGDDEYDVPERLAFALKVDGDDVEVTLKELKENYSGKVAWDRKFSELGSQKTEHDKVVETFSDNTQQFHALLGEGKAQEGIDFMLDLAGLNKHQVWNTLISQLAPTIGTFLDMSEGERTAHNREQELVALKHDKERLEQEQKQSVSRSQFESQKAEAVKTYGLNDKHFEVLHQELKRLDVLPEDQITPDVVGQYYTALAQDALAEEVLSEVDKDLAKDKAALRYLVTLQIENPELTKSELKEYAESAFLDKASKALSKRVKKDAKVSKSLKPKGEGRKQPKKPSKKPLRNAEDAAEYITKMFKSKE